MTVPIDSNLDSNWYTTLATSGQVVSGSLVAASVPCTLKEAHDGLARLLQALTTGELTLLLPDNSLLGRQLTLISGSDGWSELQYTDLVHGNFELRLPQLDLGSGGDTELIRAVREQLLQLLKICSPYLNEMIVGGLAQVTDTSWSLSVQSHKVERFELPTDQALAPVLFPRQVLTLLAYGPGLTGHSGSLLKAVDSAMLAKSMGGIKQGQGKTSSGGFNRINTTPYVPIR